ncbi:EthD family reductase [Aquisalimonas lutea]|uniref:EthD family reductase n=1 Tax=Aquisalimonas lutea TaxID=1327750 RepID=UPI0025B32BB3|nr:EthD family reductase [Aquisalimonas lutea]MDN3519810.1 EthD family reductase [Aquisalimonas lutea]
MVKIAIILFRNSMSLEEQHRWWLEEHAPMARKMPGLRGYTINLSAKGEGGEEPEIAGTDYLEFDDWESAMKAYQSVEWNEAREHTAKSGAKAIRTWIKETRHILEE